MDSDKVLCTRFLRASNRRSRADKGAEQWVNKNCLMSRDVLYDCQSASKQFVSNLIYCGENRMSDDEILCNNSADDVDANMPEAEAELAREARSTARNCSSGIDVEPQQFQTTISGITCRGTRSNLRIMSQVEVRASSRHDTDIDMTHRVCSDELDAVDIENTKKIHPQHSLHYSAPISEENIGGMESCALSNVENWVTSSAHDDTEIVMKQQSAAAYCGSDDGRLARMLEEFEEMDNANDATPSVTGNENMQYVEDNISLNVDSFLKFDHHYYPESAPYVFLPEVIVDSLDVSKHCSMSFFSDEYGSDLDVDITRPTGRFASSFISPKSVTPSPISKCESDLETTLPLVHIDLDIAPSPPRRPACRDDFKIPLENVANIVVTTPAPSVVLRAHETSFIDLVDESDGVPGKENPILKFAKIVASENTKLKKKECSRQLTLNSSFLPKSHPSNVQQSSPTNRSKSKPKPKPSIRPVSTPVSASGFQYVAKCLGPKQDGMCKKKRLTKTSKHTPRPLMFTNKNHAEGPLRILGKENLVTPLSKPHKASTEINNSDLLKMVESSKKAREADVSITPGWASKGVLGLLQKPVGYSEEELSRIHDRRYKNILLCGHPYKVGGEPLNEHERAISKPKPCRECRSWWSIHGHFSDATECCRHRQLYEKGRRSTPPELYNDDVMCSGNLIKSQLSALEAGADGASVEESIHDTPIIEIGPGGVILPVWPPQFSDVNR